MPDHQIIILDTPILRSQCKLGEGPVWDTREHVLWFVDIPNGEIHRYDPKTEEHTKQAYGKAIGNIVLRERQPGILVAAARELYRTDPAQPGVLISVAQPVPADNKAFQMNDGYADAEGRWLTGTKNNERPGEDKTAELYSFAPDGTVKTLISGVRCSNGLGFSPDNKLMYFIDTPTGKIDLYDYDLATGSISNKRVFARLPSQAAGDARGKGGFDGLCMDTDGNIYVALWQRSTLYRYSPQGEVTLEIRFPHASNITAPVFGGPDLDELYITTASCVMSGEPELVDKYPQGGDVFRVKLPGVKGREKFRCRWEGDVQV